MKYREVSPIESISKIYAWDFILSDGDTYIEKLEDLYQKVSIFCLTSKDSSNMVIVSAGKELASGLAVYTTFNLPDIKMSFKHEQQADGRLCVGNVKHDCGDSYCADFQLYQDQQMPRDEVWVFNGESRIIIKVFNFVFMENIHSPVLCSQIL